MKRPLLVLMIGLVLGELIGYLMYEKGFFIPASLVVLYLLYSRYRCRQKPFFNFLSFWLIVISMSVGIASFSLEARRVAELNDYVSDTNDESYVIQGQIIACKESSSGYLTLTLKHTSMRQERGEKRCEKISITGKPSSDLRLYEGDMIRVRGRLSPLEESRNPGAFDQKRYYLSNGIYLSGYFSEIESVKRPRYSLVRLAIKCKERMEITFLRGMHYKDYAMLSAMVFGDKSNLTLEQKKLYEENGVAHLLAVSGLHVSAIGGKCYRFLRKRKRGYALSCMAGAAILLFYACMTGYRTSVVRAITMYLIFLGSEYLGQAYDLISSMSLSAIMMIIEEPYRILEGGFLISYASVVAIGLLIPVVLGSVKGSVYEGKPREGMGKFIRIKILESLVIYSATFPLVMFFYYECSPYAILLNPLVVPSMSIVMTSALAGSILGLFDLGDSILLHLLWKILCAPALLILRVYDGLFTCVRSFPGSLIITGRPSLLLILFLYLTEVIIFFLWTYRRNLHPRRFLLTAFAWLSLCIVLLSGYRSQRQLRITMLDVGQGDCILIRFPNGHHMLMDGGSTTEKNVFKNILQPALCYYGVRKLDYVILTHMDEDHMSAIFEMMEEGYPVENLILGETTDVIRGDYEDTEKALLQLAKNQGSQVKYMSSGDSLRIGKVLLQCLNPSNRKNYEERNDKSLVFLLRYDRFTALFTGDLTSQEEEALPLKKESINLLKVAHHGSKYSTSDKFLLDIKPVHALISAGKNNRYGHPHAETLARLEDCGTVIFETLLSGAICADSDGEGSRVYYWTNRGK